MTHPKTLLSRLEAVPLRRLSQNFLVSPHWAERLVDAVIEGAPVDEIWEIGPGLGALTAGLLEKASVPVRAFELDRKLGNHLEATYPMLRLERGDVLDVDLETLARGKRIALLSNLPYHLSSPLLVRTLRLYGSLDRLVLTFQREFAARVVASVGEDNYGSLAVLMNAAYRIETLGILPPGAFYPAPEVDSQALRLIPREPEEGAPERFRKLELLVRAAFAHRRKKLVSNLRERFPSVPWADELVRLGLAADVRAQVVPIAAFRALSECIDA